LSLKQVLGYQIKRCNLQVIHENEQKAEDLIEIKNN
jgi:hypothetical protein